MTKDLKALEALKEAVEAGDLSRLGYNPYPPLKEHHFKIIGSMRGIMDAALSLLTAVLPGWSWSATTFGDPQEPVYAVVVPTTPDGTVCDAYATTPSRALLLAILTALIEMEKAKE